MYLWEEYLINFRFHLFYLIYKCVGEYGKEKRNFFAASSCSSVNLVKYHSFTMEYNWYKKEKKRETLLQLKRRRKTKRWP